MSNWIVSFTANTVTGTCPDGFSAGWYGVGKCYLIIRDKMAAFTAQMRCRDYNAKLVTIGSKSENDYLATTIYNQGRKLVFVIANICRDTSSVPFSVASNFSPICFYFTVSVVILFLHSSPMGATLFKFAHYSAFLVCLYPWSSNLISVFLFRQVSLLHSEEIFPRSSRQDVLLISSSPYCVCKRNMLNACTRLEYSLRHINNRNTFWFSTIIMLMCWCLSNLSL